MLLNPLTFHAPTSLSELTKLYASLENVKLQAGGTFLLNALKLLKRKGSKTPEHVISLGKVADLHGIEVGNDTVIIKSMTTIDDILNSTNLDDNLVVLKTVCQNISTQQIRNMATIGGNLTCRYTWTEMPAVSIGLEAKLHFIDSNGNEEIINPEDFFAQSAKTDKICTQISIPKDPSASIAYCRIKKSQFVDIPLLSLMIKTHLKDGQFNNTIVAVNNCVAFAQRDKKLEEFLNGKACSDRLAQEALDHLDETIYDKRSSDYKKYIFRVAIKNAINELIEKNKD